MTPDLRRAVRLDQALHGERFIRLEFALASLLFAVLAGLTIRSVFTSFEDNTGPQISISAAAVVFIGLAINYLALLWLTRGPVPSTASATRGELRSITWRLSLLILLPGACALLAWHQRCRGTNTD